MMEDPLSYYEKAGATLIETYEAISSSTLYATVSGHLPDAPARILDVGAGTGRDAAWFASLGHHVTAVEPVHTFRAAAQQRHGSCAIWVDDRLPNLGAITQGRFDCIVLSAVWHHLTRDQQTASAHRLETLLETGGRLILSIRHSADHDPILQTADTLAKMRAHGLNCVFQARVPSVQAHNHKAGVSWTWVVFERKI